MALTDVNFQEGEGQDIIVEMPFVARNGVLSDINVEANGAQYPVLETPLIVGGGGGGNIFIMSE